MSGGYFPSYTTDAQIADRLKQDLARSLAPANPYEEANKLSMRPGATAAKPKTPYGSSPWADYYKGVAANEAAAPAVPTAPTLQLPGLPPQLAGLVPGLDVSTLRKNRRGQLQDIAAQSAAMDAEYTSQKADIQNRYKLSRTKKERDFLQWQLADLEAQHGAAKKAVATSFSRAQAMQTDLGAKMMQEAAARAGAAQSAYGAAAGNMNAASAAPMTGSAAALTGGQPVQSVEAATGSSFAQTAGQIQADAINNQAVSNKGMLDFAATLLGGEAASQQGALERTVANNSAAMQTNWYNTTQERIQRDKEAMYAALDAAYSNNQLSKKELAAERRDVKRRTAEAVQAARSEYSDRLSAAKAADAQAQYDWQVNKADKTNDFAMAMADRKAEIEIARLKNPAPIPVNPATTAKLGKLGALSYTTSDGVQSQIDPNLARTLVGELLRSVANRPEAPQAAALDWVTATNQMFPGVYESLMASGVFTPQELGLV